MVAEARAGLSLVDHLSPDALTEAPFYIPATGPASRPRRTLKYDDTFIVVDSHGDIGASAGGPDGLFHQDTRYLSRLEVLVDGHQPLLLGSNVRDDNAVLAVDLTNPDIYVGGHVAMSKDTVHIVRTLFLWRGIAYQRLGLRNYGDRRVTLRLTINFDSDFADLFEVRGTQRRKRGILAPPLATADRVVLTYQGLDGKARRTAMLFDPVPTELEPGSAVYVIEMQPGESRPVFLTVNCNQFTEQKPLTFLRALRHARRELKVRTGGAATVQTSNEIFNEVLCRAMADLSMLMTDTPQGRYPYAGIPWYSTTFGRDGIITALQMLWVDPSIARGVLRRLAAHQAKAVDAASDAQPGKILHEMRAGEMAELREIPFGLYYGSVDSTPLFVLLAGLYAERTGDDETLSELWPAIEAGLRWIDQYGDADHDGLVEYQRATEEGLANQGWKDSQDAIFHADGTLARGSIALAEVQGYVYAANRVIARCARRLGRGEHAARLETQARQLAERFEQAFWCPELDTYAVALDGAKKPCRVRTSNAGQVLFSGIARADRAAKVAEGLLTPSFFSGWGIRTVASGEARYNPMSYHNGSIWPHDNSLIALGFARYGLKRAVSRVFDGLFTAASYMEFRRLPELFCGFQRARNRGPTLYPVACAPQAWASATPFTLIEAALGLEFDPAAGEIRLRNPQLPAFLDEILLRNLRLNNASVDLRVHRHRDDVSVEVVGSRGKIQVSVLYAR